MPKGAVSGPFFFPGFFREREKKTPLHVPASLPDRRHRDHSGGAARVCAGARAAGFGTSPGLCPAALTHPVTRAQRCLCASAIRALSSGVLAPVDMPP
jgi:hypothetical protein